MAKIQSTQATDIPDPSKKKIPALFFLPNEEISRSMLADIKDKVLESDNKQIYLVVKSRGGDAYSAVRIMKHIRTKYKTVIGVVPDYAYSAATLLLLGCNRIVVSPEGYMGPIDKPMEHSETGESISALDVIQSMSNLSSLVAQQALTFYDELRGNSSEMPENISKKDALEVSWKYSVELIKPIMEKIDPVLLQKAYRDLRIGLYYGSDLLNDSMIKESRKCRDIAGRLVHSYPSHGYAIFRDEMKKLGLIIEDLEQNSDQEHLLEKYNGIGQGIVFIEDIYA